MDLGLGTSALHLACGLIMPTCWQSSANHRHRTAERGARSRHDSGGRMSQYQQSAVRNQLLAALPPDDFALLRGSLRPLDLVLKQTLHAPDQPIETIYFPEQGMVSMVAALEGGQLMEVGLVGREGLVGLPVVLGAESGSVEAMVQVP